MVYLMWEFKHHGRVQRVLDFRFGCCTSFYFCCFFYVDWQHGATSAVHIDIFASRYLFVKVFPRIPTGIQAESWHSAVALEVDRIPSVLLQLLVLPKRLFHSSKPLLLSVQIYNTGF